MRADLLEQAGMVCPRCRGPALGASPLRLERVLVRNGDEVLDGILACGRPQCAARYPVLRGVPVVVKDLTRWWEAEGRGGMGPLPGDPALAGFLHGLEEGSRSSRGRRGLLGCQAEFHYGAGRSGGARLEPAGPPAEDYWSVVAKLLDVPDSSPRGLVLDMGCSVGRATFELARKSVLAVGIDLSLEQVAWAEALRRGDRVTYERLRHGCTYEKITLDLRLPENAFFAVADALDPPFLEAAFDLVAALNLLDSVSLPLVLLGQMDALLKPGGDLVLGSPYAWSEDIADAGEWLEREGATPARFVREILEGGALPATGFRYSIVEERDRVAMPLRQHDRHVSVFDVHLLRATRAPADEKEIH